MGGKDAKNRRKLQRQHLQQQQDDAGGVPSPSSVGYSGHSKSMQKEFNRQNHNHEKFSGSNTGSKPRRAPKDYNNTEKPRRAPKDNQNNNHTPSNNNTPPTSNKKKKFQKPKHLKRKLEKVDDETVKEKLLEELQTFQKIKEKTTPNSKKKLKKSHHDDTAMEIEDSADFPRSTTTTPTTKAVMGTKATTQELTGIPKFGEGKTLRQKKATKEAQAVEAKAPKKNVAKPKAKQEKTKTQPEEEKSEKQQKNEKADESSSSSSDSDSDEEVAPVDATKKKPETTITPKVTKETTKKQPEKAEDNDSSSSSDGSDSDSDDDSDNEETTQRTRGRGRKGRKDTSEKVQEQTKEQIKKDKEEKENSKSNNKERYCKGRKPVTDFVVGQTYPAKVVYMKPFGVFFDIGCHSDAFCHVSRLSDDYVESPEKMFQEGAEVPEVRVLEVDRKTKRITVSLQSLARQEDEKASMEARKNRRQKQRGGSKTPSSSSAPHKTRPSPDDPSPSSSSREKPSPSFSHHTMNEETRPEKPKIIISAKDIRKEPVKPAVVVAPKPTAPIINKPESEMTPAELKRARKIARRAERRAQQEQEGAAAQ